MKQLFSGVFDVKGNVATINAVPGFRVYGEKLVNMDGAQYRMWDPFRSKLCAAINNKLKNFPFNKKTNVLYLGSSSGTTASHIADITRGNIYCVEFSKRMMREFMIVCEKRRNMIPVLADARHPGEFFNLVDEVDVIYQDVAQPDQAGILIANAKVFKPKYAMLSIKARSINAVKTPKQIFREEIDKLKEKFEILEKIDLKPYQEDHVLVNLRYRG